MASSLDRLLGLYCDPELEEEEHEKALDGVLDRIADTDASSADSRPAMSMMSADTESSASFNAEDSLTIPDLIGRMQKQLSSGDEKVRRRATLLLAQIFDRRPNVSLKPAAVHLLVVFLCNRLKDELSLEPALHALQALLTHHRDSMLAKYHDHMDVLHAIVTDVHIQGSAQSIRSRAFTLMALVLDSLHAGTVSGMQGTDDWLRGLVAAGEGEKDPRCLLQFLKILKRCSVVFQHAFRDSHTLQQLLFDAVECYFPITFAPPPDDVFGVTTDMLVDALQAVMCSPPLLRLSTPFLIEQLEIADLSIGKRHSLQALVQQAKDSGVRETMGTKGHLTRFVELTFELCTDTTADQASVCESALWAVRELSAICERELRAIRNTKKTSGGSAAKGKANAPEELKEEVDTEEEKEKELADWRALPEALLAQTSTELQRAGLAGLKSRHAARVAFAVARAGYMCCAAAVGRVLPLLLPGLETACERLGTTIKSAAAARVMGVTPDSVSAAVQQERNAAAAVIGILAQLLQCLPSDNDTSSAGLMTSHVKESYFLDATSVQLMSTALLSAIPAAPLARNSSKHELQSGIPDAPLSKSSSKEALLSTIPDAPSSPGKNASPAAPVPVLANNVTSGPLLMHDDRLQLASVLQCLYELLSRVPTATASRAGFVELVAAVCVRAEDAFGPVVVLNEVQAQMQPQAQGQELVVHAARAVLRVLASHGHHETCVRQLATLATAAPRDASRAFAALAHIAGACSGAALDACMNTLQQAAEGGRSSLRMGALQALESLFEPVSKAGTSSDATQQQQRAERLLVPTLILSLLRASAPAGVITDDSRQALKVITMAQACVPAGGRESAADAVLAFSHDCAIACKEPAAAHLWATHWAESQIPVEVIKCIPACQVRAGVAGEQGVLLAAEAAVAALGPLSPGSALFRSGTDDGSAPLSSGLTRAIALVLLLASHAEKSGSAESSRMAGLLLGSILHRLPKSSLLDALLTGALHQFWHQCKSNNLDNAGPVPLMWAARAIFSRAEVKTSSRKAPGGESGASWQHIITQNLLVALTGQHDGENTENVLPPTYAAVSANMEMALAIVSSLPIICAELQSGWHPGAPAFLWRQRLWQRMFPRLQAYMATSGAASATAAAKSSRIRYLLSICGLAAHMPFALIAEHVDVIATSSLEALIKLTEDYNGDLESECSAGCLSQCLQTLHLVATSDLSILSEHLNTAVPLLLMLAQQSPRAKNRALALACMQDAGALPHSRLHPLRKTVLRGLSKIFNDKKRAVRKLAADTRETWSV